MSISSRKKPQLLVPCSLSLFAVFLLLLPSPDGWRPGFRSSRAGANALAISPATQQVVYCSLWRTDRTFTSTIHLKNSFTVGSLAVVPVLYMADGTEYDLNPILIPPSGITMINVNDALAHAPEGIAPHISDHGSAALRYFYQAPTVLAGHMQILSIPESLIFDYSFEPVMAEAPAQHTLEGLWWKHDEGVTGFLGLSNNSSRPHSVSFQVTGPRGSETQSQLIMMNPHESRLLRLQPLPSEGSEEESQAGGILVQYNGSMGEIVVAGGLENPQNGYSATMAFWLHDPSAAQPASVTYGSAGIMVGKPDPMMGFPSGLRFTPYAVLRNTSLHPLVVSPALYTMLSGQTQSFSLPDQHLAPREARVVPLAQTMKALGIGNLDGMITLSFKFTGLRGDLLLATGSVDQSGSFAFAVRPQGVVYSWAKEAPIWMLGNGTDTMFSIWNPGDTTEDIVAEFTYVGGTGHYRLPLHVDPKATEALDIGQLAESQQPDPEGNVVPRDVHEGSVMFSGPKGPMENINLVVSTGIFNVQTATCGDPCGLCCGLTSTSLTVSNVNVSVGSSAQAFATGDSNGVPQDVTFQANWSTSNSSVATVDASGVATGVGPGSTTLFAKFSGKIPSGGCCPECQGFCTNAFFSGSGQVTVPAPDHLQVVSDVNGQVAQCPNVVGRQIYFAVVDSSGKPVPKAPVQENFVSISQNTCGNVQPNPSACANTDGNAQFFDSITVNCAGGNGPAHCGYNLTDHWEWCAPGHATKNLGTLTEVVHVDAITVNGVTTPNRIPSGTNIFP